MLNERMKQIQERIQQVIADAQTRYNVDLSKVQVRFDLRGRSAGIAGYKWGLGARSYYLRFNRDMIGNDGFKHVIEDTVPHEIAHIVCFMRPELGRNHDAGWKRVCKALGGTGERCHKEQVVYAKGKTFQYKTTVGRLITVSERMHQKIQMGCSYTVKRGGGQLNRMCQWVRFQPGVVQLAEGPVAPKPVAPPAPKPAPSLTTPQGMSKAEAVRATIRKAKTRGDDQQVVIEAVIIGLGMARSMAKKYVSENWDRA